ncbi:MAG: UDPGP type 1 family protein [Thermodesulfobacteriota bacterium]|nr:UDPGP type 1 family protein [Thermodesulfobacteriota bacterium]
MPEERLKKDGQSHIARLIKNNILLSKRVERDLEEIDLCLIQRLLKGDGVFAPPGGKIKPAQVVPASFASTPGASEYVVQGTKLLASGRVAALIVAGGQGSRLGIKGPKGAVKVSPIRGKSLFQLHAEKILALQRQNRGVIPLFIMTSRVNDAQTRQFFEENRYFGLSKEDVFFFVQGMLPSVTSQGKFIANREKGLFMNPDGHGGTFSALKKSGCLDIMKQRGIEEIFYFQVDNPLVRVCDPLFLGLHHAQGAQMSSKVVRKREATEKVGVIARVDQKIRVIEYSDMDDAMRYAKNAEGDMLYWAGSIAIHCIRRDFIEKITAHGLSLPYHRATKQIPSVDDKGRTIELEGIKFETFIFDALPLASASVTLETLREEEFAPVKNPLGEDSLESAIEMQCREHRRWLLDAGIDVAPGCSVEISPLFALGPQEIKTLFGRLPDTIDQDTYME